jgi:SAM-dependent methyltransferase
MSLSAKKADHDWEAFAKMSPYYAVIIRDEYRGRTLNEDVFEDFFQSGETHIQLILKFITDHLDRSFNPSRCLDFGCGVGRLVVPLARRFAQVIGVDISATMLAEARLNSDRHGLDNVEFFHSDDNLSQVSGKFDFIHSFIVFQHIRRQRGEKLLRRMVDLLNDNGVAALHFTYAANRSWVHELKYWVHAYLPFGHSLTNIIKGRRLTEPYVMINRYDLTRLIRIVQDGGCEHSYIRFSNHDGLLGVILLFQKTSVGILR